MADFAETGEIISRCMGYQENEFLEVYHKNINMLTDEAIESHPVAIVIIRFMKDRSYWASTVTQLYPELITTAYDSKIDTFGKMWPKSASIRREKNNVMNVRNDDYLKYLYSPNPKRCLSIVMYALAELKG